MYVWDPKDVAYKEIKLEVDKVFTSEIFREVTPSGGRIAIDFLKAPYAKVALGQDTLIYNLEIQNTREGSCGKVMVYQSGLRQIVLSNTMRGTIDLPLNRDTIAILSYNRVGDHIYVHTSTVIGDTTYPAPSVSRISRLSTMTAPPARRNGRPLTRITSTTGEPNTTCDTPTAPLTPTTRRCGRV